MLVKSIYGLAASETFHLDPYEEAAKNLRLKKLRPRDWTLLVGAVRHRKKPICHASVEVTDRKGKPLCHTITDEKGLFYFRNILPPGVYKVSVSAEYYLNSGIKTAHIRKNKITKLFFCLKKNPLAANGTVYGKILESASKEPAAAARVTLTSKGKLIRRIYRTISNEDGEYLIYNIRPGAYRIIARKEGYSSGRPVDLYVNKFSRIKMNFYLLKKGYSKWNLE